MKSDELELDVEERRFLREGYLAVQPPAGRKDFLLGALSVRLPGALGPVPSDSLAPQPAQGGLAQGGLAQGGLAQGGLAQGGLAQGGLAQGGLVAKLLGGALVVGAVGFGLGTAASRQEATAGPVERGTAAMSAPGEQDLGAGTAVDGLALADLEPEPDLPAVPLPAGRPAASSAVRKQSGDAPPAPLSFYEELSYVRRAQTALANGNAVLALGLMRSLTELRPDGALLAERGVTEVLALCALDRESEARGVAEHVRARSDGSMYVARLQKTCANVAQAAEPNDSGDERSTSATSTEQAARRKQ